MTNFGTIDPNNVRSLSREELKEVGASINHSHKRVENSYRQDENSR